MASATFVDDSTVRGQVRALLNFEIEDMDAETVYMRSQELASIAHKSGATYALMGGAPFFMAPLEAALKEYGITPVYSKSRRVSKEVVKDDGSVEKVSIFQHEGWYFAV